MTKFIAANSSNHSLAASAEAVVFAAGQFLVVDSIHIPTKYITAVSCFGSLIITAHLNGSCIVWHLVNGKWTQKYQFSVPGSILAVASHGSFVACSDSACHVYLHDCDNSAKMQNSNNQTSLHALSIAPHNSLALRFAVLPDSNHLILLSAGTNRCVTVFSIQNGLLVNLLHLKGHSDWIRSLDIVSPKAPASMGYAPSDLLLASASQDKFIRLWKFSAKSEIFKSKMYFLIT